MNNTNEIWKPIEGYETYYEVSNLGNIKSLSRLKKGVRYGKPYEYQTKEILLKQYIDNKGYLRVKLQKDGNKQMCKVHRIVAKTFLGDIYNKEIDHINTIKTDNRVTNLKIVTSKENANNPLTKEHIRKANKGKASKTVMCIMQDGSTIIFSSMTEAVEKGYGKITGISRCCNGKNKSHNNKRWQFIN